MPDTTDNDKAAFDSFIGGFDDTGADDFSQPSRAWDYAESVARNAWFAALEYARQTPQSIFIVIGHFDHESDMIVAIHTSRESAEAKAREPGIWRVAYHRVTVEEWTPAGPNPANPIAEYC